MIIYPADVVLFEGILAFYFPEIRDLFHMKLFVDTDSDTRLSRRGNDFIIQEPLSYTFDRWKYIQTCFYYWLFSAVVRDITERGRDLEQILAQYMTFVKPAFEEFCSPVCQHCWFAKTNKKFNLTLFLISS